MLEVAAAAAVTAALYLETAAYASHLCDSGKLEDQLGVRDNVYSTSIFVLKAGRLVVGPPTKWSRFLRMKAAFDVDA